MEQIEGEQAVSAATVVAAELGLPVEAAVVLHDSNKLTVRLVPCDTVARIARGEPEHARWEVDLASRLAGAGAPVASLDPRVPPRVYERDGFVVTLWEFYPSAGPPPLAADLVDALVVLHTAMRGLDVVVPHFTDRTRQARRLLADPDLSPELERADRALLLARLDELQQGVLELAGDEQLIHGEPHPGNVLVTSRGLRFIDLETCCRGPAALDVAHLPEDVGNRYPDVDLALLDRCRGLVLAMVAAWRWDAGDRFPDGRRAAMDLLAALREGPPWPTLDQVMPTPS